MKKVENLIDKYAKPKLKKNDAGNDASEKPIAHHQETAMDDQVIDL